MTCIIQHKLICKQKWIAALAKYLCFITSIEFSNAIAWEPQWANRRSNCHL